MEVTKMSDEEKKVESEATVETEAVSDDAATTEDTMAAIIHDPNAPIMTMRKLLDAGVHFGHQTRRWNPKMGKFIYGARNGIYLIDMAKTVEQVNVSYKKLKDIVDQGGKVLFVGTKDSAKQIVVDEATRSGSFYIANRWLGGTLTNFRTILGRTKKLKELEDMEAAGEFDKLPKKEVALLKKELEKLSRNLEGIKEMRRLPQAVIVDDPTVEHNAIEEARKLHIPTFAICDTSDDPDIVDFPIPSNNDAPSALKLLIGVLADAVVESKGGVTEYAYVKDTVEEATMKDAVRAADIANEQRKAAIRAQRQAREERFRKMQAERQARFAARNAAQNATAPKAEGEAAAAPKADESKAA
ncbi:MAG: 30S ribosomal protein S2 [Erysipelotrichaceae bacterium]|nr:30S ribosomal protein S2 [Erysipelotrichaceae bacterium]